MVLCRLTLPGQGDHRHPAAPGRGKAAHDEGEMVARERMPRGGQQRGQCPGCGEHWRHLHRAGRWSRAVCVRGHRRVHLHVAQKQRY